MTQEYLLKTYLYRDGFFYNKKTGHKVLGKLHRSGHRLLGIKTGGKCKWFRYHRAIWLWHYGSLPSGIDHANRNPQDNRIENLRAADQSFNGANQERRSTNKSGLKGVSFAKNHKSKPWRADIQISGRRKNLGYFSSKEEAAKAYDVAAKSVWGDFSCGNF